MSNLRKLAIRYKILRALLGEANRNGRNRSRIMSAMNRTRAQLSAAILEAECALLR